MGGGCPGRTRCQIVLDSIFQREYALYRPLWTTDDICRECVVAGYLSTSSPQPLVRPRQAHGLTPLCAP